MRQFKTSLLWLAFILLILQSWVDIQENILWGFIYRLAPSLCLLIWFILSLFFKQILIVKANEIPKWAINSIRILRPLASSLIVLGALFKLMHWTGGFLLLIAGIGIMAIYSSILNYYSSVKNKANIDIIDDIKL
jgi:hypothetical protein